ncbi:hypothetical protein AS9A_1360 [Hoyosella subflava DQS3-9A1]|uniref:Uncharacterized protein n=1 Tax=Hoyosella subflava (strain DSM 45089 / JCM 17490 / NBRC 109087 / DQS3-9A1) TaxID=443218 RepID=F6EG87_HOYSD|nr:hypothetical protein AS9A_1360 [Hoyosella subflava DQS3-9A1]
MLEAPHNAGMVQHYARCAERFVSCPMRDRARCGWAADSGSEG